MLLKPIELPDFVLVNYSVFAVEMIYPGKSSSFNSTFIPVIQCYSRLLGRIVRLFHFQEEIWLVHTSGL